MKTRTIKVDYLARVEGEGALFLKIRDQAVVEVKLKIMEPPRFFEALLRGRHFTEAPDITARICGICPVAYQHGAAQAMEQICGVSVAPAVRDLRRLIYCGEWIESHILHGAMLHAPDFLGYRDAIEMAKDHPELVKAALRLKKCGNELMRVIGGREIHPINCRVGGYYKAPRRRQLQDQVDALRWSLDAAEQFAATVGGLAFPEFEQDYEFVALRHPDEYPLNEGRLVSSRGIDVPIAEYDRVLIETHQPHSTALHTQVAGRGPCMVGPLARYALNHDRLTPRARQVAQKLELGAVCRNPFKSIMVRAVEVVFAVEEALQIIERYQPPDPPAVAVSPRAGTGFGCTEAPRGICYHRYSIDDRGVIVDAKIVSPTAVNQAMIEQDLYDFVGPRLALSDDRLQWECEQAIRNYDPCISCSAHFLKLQVDRG